jgi:uncharacterized protein YciI
MRRPSSPSVPSLLAALALLSILPSALPAQASPDAPPAPAPPPRGYDEALARKLGADDYGMRNYVMVVLKTGPTPVPAGPERDAMFRGHFANMQRLAKEGVLAHAGPLDGIDGWRGLFILAVATIEDAKKHVATDPVILRGEMIAEYHTHYGSAALMQVNEAHEKLAKKSF